MHSRTNGAVPDDECFDPPDQSAESPALRRFTSDKAENTCPMGTLSRTYIPEPLKAHNPRLTIAAQLHPPMTSIGASLCF
jgi:hypothetical protein